MELANIINMNYLSPPIFPGKSIHSSVNFSCRPRKLNHRHAIRASDSEISTDGDGSVRWLLQPIGDGDTRHIGYKIPRPGAFEIVPTVVTIGRVGDKADIVIPVPTVSGLHARIQKAEENLLVMDLNSTNGTFIDEKRLQPGIVYPASPGNLVAFGDTNLAIFRVDKLDDTDEITTDTNE